MRVINMRKRMAKAIRAMKNRVNAPAREFSLAGGVTPYGGGFRKPDSRRFGRFCALTGVASTANLAQALAQLPVECWPRRNSSFVAFATNLKPVRLDVSPQCLPCYFNCLVSYRERCCTQVTQRGVVRWAGGAPQSRFISLDSITFPVRQYKGLRGLTMADGWVSSRTRPVEIVEQHGLCMMRGRAQVKSGSAQGWTEDLLTLPPACRPTGGSVVFNINHHDEFIQLTV